MELHFILYFIINKKILLEILNHILLFHSKSLGSIKLFGNVSKYSPEKNI